MSEEEKELLRKAYIDESWWGFCKVENGVIFTPDADVLFANGLITEQEYNMQKPQQIDILPGPTPEERLKKLEEEKAVLAQNVYQLASIVEIMIGGTTDGQAEDITTTTTN